MFYKKVTDHLLMEGGDDNYEAVTGSIVVGITEAKTEAYKADDFELD